MKKGRMIGSWFIVCLLTINCFSLPVSATITSNYLEFERKPEGASTIYVSKFLSDSFSQTDTLVIPSTVMLEDTGEECTVNAIGRNVFQNCKAKNIQITSTVQVISGYAFEGATVSGSDLENLSGEAGVITIGNGVLQIGEYAFANVTCSSVKIANSVRVIEQHAFSGITLNSFELPTSIVRVDANAFPDSPDVTITIPEEVTNFSKINLTCYQNTVFQLNVNAPVTVQQYFIENNISYKVGETGEIHKPSEETTTEKPTETTTEKPTEATTEKPTEATTEKSTEVSTQTSTESPSISIGKIYEVKKLRYKVTGKNTVTFVGSRKKSITSLVVPKTVKLNKKSYKVTAVGAKACKGYKKLKKVTIGDNVTKIGTQAFSGCSRLRTVRITSKKLKSVGKKAFKNVPAKAEFRIPKSKAAAYKRLIEKSK